MSGSGFRGRGFGPRSNRPHGGFAGPPPNFNQNRRSTNHPNFNQNRRSDNWRDNLGPNSGPRFNRHSGNGPQFQGHNQGHQRHYYNNGPGGYHERGMGFRPARFSGMRGRDSERSIRDLSRESFRDRQFRYPREEEKRNFFDEFQEPLLGSEEERQQKISKTVDKLKQALSSFTEDDTINFWEDNFTPPSPGPGDPSTSNKGIPELKHGPPELDLTFNDFKVIGRVDLDTSFKNDSDVPGSEQENNVFDDSNEASKRAGQRQRDDDTLGEDCLYLDDPQEEEFISQFDGRLTDCNINFPQPNTSNTSDVTEFNNQDQLDTEINQSKEFISTENIITEFQIEECVNSPNLQFDIDPSFAENITDPVQNELSNFEEGTIFDPCIEPQLEIPIEETEATAVPFGEGTVINNPEILDTDLQTSEFPFEKAEKSDEEIQQFQTELTNESQQTEQIELFTAFESTEPPPEILQEEFQNTTLPLETEASSDQIFDANAPLPELSQQESNLFFEELDQMQGNFPECEKESSNEGQSKIPENVESNAQKLREEVENSAQDSTNNSTNNCTQNLQSCEKSIPESCDDIQQTNSLSNSSKKKKKRPLKTQKPLEPPPMFDPMEAFPDLLEEEPLQPPPMFELGEPPDFLQNCADSNSNSSIRTSERLDLREESQHSRSSFDQKKPPLQEEVLQPPPAFDPRGPPPTVTVFGEDRSYKPPGFSKQEEVIQPPKVFDPRLTSHQRMDFVAKTGPDIVPPHWAGGMTDFNMATTFVPQMHVPPISQAAGYLPPVGYNMAPGIPPIAPAIPLDFPPPLPHQSQAQPPLPVEPPSIPEPLGMLSMVDELEEMQEAMEFAKQFMNMTESDGKKKSEDTHLEMTKTKEKKSRKSKEEKSKDFKSREEKHKKKEDTNVEYGPAPLLEMVQEQAEHEPENAVPPVAHDDMNLPGLEDAFTDDQIRPKVVFNLNKVKRIHKVDEWQQQQQPEEVDDAKMRKKKSLKEREDVQSTAVFEDKLEEDRRKRTRRGKDRKEDLPNRISKEDKYYLHGKMEEKAHSSPKPDLHKKSSKKHEHGDQESWKNRVINQFLKMSKNDICNMINNTSLRRFDIAMKQLVKERKTSLSQEMRNNEEEKVREYDREEFMTQLNAMLDPGASVDITNLPTEFIQHLSVVLHLDPMPGDKEESGMQVEMMDQEDLLRQIGLENKIQKFHEQHVSEEEYLHLPKQPSPTLALSIPEKKKSRHHEKKIVQVIRLKEPINQTEAHEQSSRTSKESKKSSRERENGEVNFRNSIRESQSREAQILEAQIRDEQIRQQQVREAEIREQQFREHQLREQQLREQQIRDQQIREQQIREQQMREAKAKAEAKLREAELREAEIREAELRELQKKQAQLKAQLAREMLISGSSLNSESPPHLTSVLDDIFKPALPKGKSESRTKPNRSETVTKPPGKYPTLGTMERTLDDIFSAGIARAKASSKTASADLSLEQQQQWTRKKRENVDTYRNLTKEEWEAKHGKSMSDAFEKEFNALMLRRAEAETLHSKVNDRTQKKSYQWDETPLPERINDEGAERLLVRHKDSLEEGELADSNYDSDEDSSSTSSSESDSDDSENIPTDVTKLLKVIKEREKVAKKKSLNEVIRDEVAADLEKKKKEKDKHKERRSRKKKKREKKVKKRKRTRKHRKKTKRVSMSGTDKDIPDKLLTEDEIKKEVKDEPVSPEEKKVEKKIVIAQNKTALTQAFGVKTTGNSPAKVNVEYGQTKNQLMKTKAQLKQMPETSGIKPSEIETSTKIRLNAETQTQTTSTELKVDNQDESEKGKGEDKETKESKENKENKETKEIKETSVIEKKDKELIEQLEKPVSDKKIDEDVPVVEKKSEEVQVSEIIPVVEQKSEEVQTSEDIPVVEKKSEEVQTTLESLEPPASEVGTVEEPVKEVKSQETTTTTDENKSAETEKPSSGPDGDKKPKRIDIKAYKARTLERRKKEQEKFKELAQNPISLTTDLLNIPLANKSRGTESLKDQNKIKEKTISNLKEPKTVEIQKSKELKDQKLNQDPQNVTALRDPRRASKAAQESLPAHEKTSNELDPNKNKVQETPQDDSKFKHIKSEGGKELKLKNKPKSAKKIKNQSSPLVVIEQKIESPARRSSISSESDYSRGSTNSKLPKTTEDSKRKQKQKTAPPIKKSKSDVKTPKEKVTKTDEVFEEKIPTEKEVSKEQPSKSDEKSQKKDVSKENEKPPIKPVRKLKVYGKPEKKISDGLPDTVPSEEIAKYYAMEIDSYPSLLQDLIEDPVDVCPAKEVFFGNMSLKEDDISDMKPAFEGDGEQKSKQLVIEEINPMENIIFDGDVLDADLQESNIVYTELNPCELSPKTSDIFQPPSFEIDECDQNLRLDSADLPPILTESELNNVKFENKSFIEQLSECESESLIIRDNVRLGIQEPDQSDFGKNDIERNVQEFFEPTISQVETVFDKADIPSSKFPSDFENEFEPKYENATLETPCLLNHVVPIESRETGDLIQLIEEAGHVALPDFQEKALCDDELNTESVIEVGTQEFAHPDLFTIDVSCDKDDKVVSCADSVNENKESRSEFSESPAKACESADAKILFPISEFNEASNNSTLALMSVEDVYKNSVTPTVEINLQNKPKKVSEVVLQSSVTLIRPENTDFHKHFASEKSISEKQIVQTEDLKCEYAISDKESETGKVQVSAESNFADLNLEVRLHPLEADSRNSKQESNAIMGVKHLSQQVDDKALHKLKQKRKMKRKKEKKIKGEVKEALKEAVKPITTQSLMARMKEIDDEIQKLMLEKLSLYQMMGNANVEQNFASGSGVPENVASDVSSKENLGDLNGNKTEASRKQKPSPEDDEVAFFNKEQNSKDQKENVQLKEKSLLKLKKPSVPSEDEEVAKISEKKSKKLSKTGHLQSKFRKNAQESSSEDEELVRISKEKSKKLSKARSQSRMKKTNDSDTDSEIEKMPLDKLKKLAEKLKPRLKYSSENDEEKKAKKSQQRRPKSVMRLFSKEKFINDEEENKKTPKKKQKIIKRSKSAMKLSSKVTESSEVTSGDEEVAMLNLNNKKKKIKSPKNATEAMQMRPKSAMKLSTSKLIPNSEDEESKKKEDESKLTKTPKSRKRPKSVMMKSCPKSEDSDEEAVKKKKIKESPSLNTEQKIFVKIKGKHEREKLKKKENSERKAALPVIQVNRLDDPTKKKVETSPEAKKGEKNKKTNSSTPRKERKDEDKILKHSKVKALDSSLIYSDESTLEPLESTKSNKAKKSSTGLALLDQVFRKEIAEQRKQNKEDKEKKKAESLESEKEVESQKANQKIQEDENNQKTDDQNNQIVENQNNQILENQIPAIEISAKVREETSPLKGNITDNEVSPLKGFPPSQINYQFENPDMEEAPLLSPQVSQNPEKVLQESTNEIEEESLNQEVQRINSNIEDQTTNNDKPETKMDKTSQKETFESSKVVQEFSHPSLKDLSDKDFNKAENERSILMSPISDISTRSGDSNRKRKRPARSQSRAEKIRRSSRYQDSEDEPDKLSRASSRQRRQSQTSNIDSEPPKKKIRTSNEKVIEKNLYSKIKNLLKSEIRPKRKDKKKKKMTREEMSSCKIKLVDLKHTYMRSELNPNILRRLGLSKINIPKKNDENQVESSSSLHQDIVTVENIRRISIEELNSSTETTMYIFKMDQGNKIEAVKLRPENEKEKKNDGENSMKNSTVIANKQPEEEKKLLAEEEKKSMTAEKHVIEEREKPKNQEKEKPIKVQEKEKRKVQMKEKPIEKEKENSVKEKEKEKAEVQEKEKPVEKESQTAKGKEDNLVEIIEKNLFGEKDTQEEGPSTKTDKPANNGPSSEEVVSQNQVQTQGKEESRSSEDQLKKLQDTEIPKIVYTVHKGPILDIKIIGDSFLAASEDGAIYRYSQVSNGILNIYKGHTHAVTCLYVLNADSSNPNRRWMYSGSLDGSMRCYDIATGEQMQSPIIMGSAVQCMDQAWGAIFIGTTSGHVARYHIKAATLKGDRIQFSNKSVLALKATNEGPRKVLIVASRNQPITIRDAFTGLFLRQISGQKNYTVYSLLRHNNLIYFGTSSTSIPVYDFVTGEQKVQYNAGVGVVCMYLYERLLFAGCYDGNIYIFDIKEKKLVCSIPGPGKMLLSMAIVNKRIIAGSKDRSLHCWEIPSQAQELLGEKT